MPPVAGVSRIGTFHKSKRPFQTERQQRFGRNMNLAPACYSLCSRSTGSSGSGANRSALSTARDRTDDGPNNSATTYVLGGAAILANSLPVASIKVLRAGVHNVPPPVFKNRLQVHHHVVVTNLAKISVLLQMVQLRRLAMGVPSLRTILNEPLVGGTTWTHELEKNLFSCTGDDYQGQIAASMTFYASGRLFRTDWFRIQIQVSHGEILRLEPVNIAARRVRMLDTAGDTDQELVTDVVKANAANA